MKTRATALVAGLLLVATPAFAHRLDEYLQAVMISVGDNRVQAQIRLTPGIAVYPIVLRAIDANGDGVISDAEQRAYAERVLHDLSFAIDGKSLPIRLVSWKYADVAAMKEGRGVIVIDFDAALPPGAAARHLTFENRHQRDIAVYLVNALVPTDSAIRIAEQHRNIQQSFYRLDFIDAGVNTLAPQTAGFWAGVAAWVGAVLLVLTTPVIVSRWLQPMPRHDRAEHRR
jgi:hypothetical protein